MPSFQFQRYKTFLLSGDNKPSLSIGYSNIRVAQWLAMGVLIGLACPVGAVEITYGYDDLNRLESVVRSDGPRIDYYYDEVSNITDYQVTNSPYIQGNAAARFVDTHPANDEIPDTFEVSEP